MGLRYDTLLVCVILTSVLRGECSVPAATSELPAWTLHDCPLPSRPYRHPVSLHRPGWLNLKKRVSLSPKFWLSFYGVTHNMEACGLRAGVVYQVVSSTLPNTLQFLEQRDDDDDTQPEASDCKDEFMVLSNGSYGFISCNQNRQKATEAAWAWWGTVPYPYITIVLISVGVAMGVVLLVGLGVGVAWRRRSRGNAQLA